MPTGESRSIAGQRGFTYLGLLFAVALSGAGLAVVGQSAATAMQRERERELLFRGDEIRRAIEAYVRATPPGQPRFPRRLQDLLVDTRGATPRHHLRRLYADPFTGSADWVLLPAPGDAQGIAGVRSRSTQSSLQAAPDEPSGRPRCVCDRAFAVATPSER